jgi:hypothetical protein
MSESLRWKCHTPNLLKEIGDCTNQPILTMPLTIFRSLLVLVAQRASELNDPQLNDLMMRLTLYEAADPESEGYDPALVEEVQRLANLNVPF